MPLTLLLDLDDTLLINPLKPFMEGYLRLLSQHLSQYVDPKMMVDRMIKSTDRMIEKKQPYQTLKMVFDADFYPALGLDRDELRSVIESFYTNVFPELRSITSPRPEAIEAVRQAFSSGYKVVVATNPLFPAIATSQRLEWAGLPESEYPFDLVTSYESMHFAKPNSHYYAEILAQLGWPDQPVCMVGNSYDFDILPPRRLGIPGYLVENDHDPDQHKKNEKDVKSGPFKDLLPWLEQLASKKSYFNLEKPDVILPILHSTPGAMATLTRKLTKIDWCKHNSKNNKSISGIIDQFNVLEQANEEAFSGILPIELNPDHREQIRDLCREEIQNTAVFPHQSMLDFYYKRSVLLDKLNLLGNGHWQESVDHPIFGRIAFIEFLNKLAASDIRLFRQLETLMDLL
jgi:FMN phosphatase YigB (HAD superfamily)